MQFIDLAAQQARIRSGIEARIQAVLNHGRYIMGPEVEELEARLCAFAGARHCVACSSGTDALLMPLMATVIPPIEVTRHLLRDILIRYPSNPSNSPEVIRTKG